jgi:hypothetical protein
MNGSLLVTISEARPWRRLTSKHELGGSGVERDVGA